MQVLPIPNTQTDQSTKHVHSNFFRLHCYGTFAYILYKAFLNLYVYLELHHLYTLLQ